MNRSSLRCALSIVVHGSNVAQSEADAVFRVALSLMPVNKWSISFPLFILVADLFRTFRTFDTPADAGYVKRDDMLRHLAEQDRPHRVNTESARVIFDAIGQDHMNFPLFAFAVVIYNRW